MQILVVTSLVVVLGAGCASSAASTPSRTPSADPAAAPSERRPSRRAVQGFSSPESVLYDPVADAYLVSNIVGSPFEKDHEGFISRVSPAGEIIDLRFADGTPDRDRLNAPKGMALIGRVLYVTDIDVVRRFDADSGAGQGTFAVKGAVFLNDLAASPEGALYLTDSGLTATAPDGPPSDADAIFRIDQPAGAAIVTKLVGGKDLGHPNGVVARSGRIDVVTLGGEWLTLASDGTVRARVKLPAGGLDGLIVREDGRLVASSWMAQSLFGFADGVVPALVATGLPSPADIGYDSKRHLVLVPRMLTGELVLLSL